MEIREARLEDADHACNVLRRSISQLCVADHGSDPAIINAWLANKTPETVARWIDRLRAYAQDRLALEEPLVLAGDYNVIPTEADVHNPAAWINDALFLPTTREKFRTLINLGLTDALRAVTDESGLYTFWDYQAGAWQKNWGIRIDHLLLSPQAADRLVTAGIDKHVRSWEKPSDHVPVYIDLAIDAN